MAGSTFLGAAKIEGAFQAEAAQHLDIGLGKMAEMVGAEDLPPADRAAVFGRDNRRDRGNCWRRQD